MKLDMNTLLNNALTGEALTLNDGDGTRALKLRDAAQLALINSDAKDGAGKLADYQLLLKIQGDEVEFTTKELARIEELAGTSLTLLVVGAVHTAIHGATS